MSIEAFQQLVPPRTWVVDYPGFCHRFARHFFNAPWGYSSAWEAWEATEHKHAPEEPLPTDVSVLLWYSHWGTYGDPPRYGNWGHVTPHVPGVGIFSSPSTKLGSPAGQEIYQTIAQVEARFSATYVGWSEDINGTRVAQPIGGASAPRKREQDMYIMESSRGAALIGGGRGFEGLDGESRAILQARTTADGQRLYPTIQVNEREWDVLASLHYAPVAGAKDIAAEVIAQLPAGQVSEQAIVDAIVKRLTA